MHLSSARPRSNLVPIPLVRTAYSARARQYNFKIVRDRYDEMASAECADPYDVELAFNPLSAWGQYAD